MHGLFLGMCSRIPEASFRDGLQVLFKRRHFPLHPFVFGFQTFVLSALDLFGPFSHRFLEDLPVLVLSKTFLLFAVPLFFLRELSLLCGQLFPFRHDLRLLFSLSRLLLAPRFPLSFPLFPLTL